MSFLLCTWDDAVVVVGCFFFFLFFFFNIIHYEFNNYHFTAMHTLHFPHLSILQAKLKSCSVWYFSGKSTIWFLRLVMEIFRVVKLHAIGRLVLKGHWTSSTSSPNFFPKKVGIFIPLEVLAWVMTACRVLHSRLTYFWRYMTISSIFYFSKSTSINKQYSSLWDTLKMMLFTKYLIKWKRIGRISWKFRY